MSARVCVWLVSVSIVWLFCGCEFVSDSMLLVLSLLSSSLESNCGVDMIFLTSFTDDANILVKCDDMNSEACEAIPGDKPELSILSVNAFSVISV